MLGEKRDIYEKNRRILKEGFNIINKRLCSLSEIMLSLKMEILLYKNGNSQWTLSKINNLFEDIRLDLNELSESLANYITFMLNNNPEQFEDLIREGTEIQKTMDLMIDSFIEDRKLI